MLIGSYAELSLAKARETAKELSARVSLGYDVAGEKQERKAKALAKIEDDKNAMRVSQLAAEYFERQILPRWKHPDILRRRIDKDINPCIGQMRVEDVKPRHIDDMLKGIVDRGAPTIATDVLRWTRRIFDYGIKRHALEINPCSAFEVSDAGGKEVARERWLTRDELIRLFQAMRQAKGFSRQNELTFKLLLTLCVRKMELCAARWEEFDLEGAIMRNIDLIREVTHAAAGQWPSVLAGLSINVPDSSRRHAPCPACGGTDRFRFDDNGRGSFICNQCGAGDGLDLIKKVNRCDTTEAAQLAADVLGIDYRGAQTDPAAVRQRREQLESDRQQHEQERQQQAAEDAEQRRATFARLYAGMRQNVTQGESDYLQSKGLTGFNYPVMSDGSLLLPLVDESGTVVAAQTITPQGEKRLLTGSAKRGAYHTVNAPEQPQEVIIAEGLATTLSAYLMRPDALAVCAIDAGNLLPVAIQMRQQYPQAQIIIAADNDRLDDKPNTGTDAAENAARAATGWVAVPPTDYKADWNDLRRSA